MEVSERFPTDVPVAGSGLSYDSTWSLTSRALE